MAFKVLNNPYDKPPPAPVASFRPASLPVVPVMAAQPSPATADAATAELAKDSPGVAVDPGALGQQLEAAPAPPAESHAIVGGYLVTMEGNNVSVEDAAGSTRVFDGERKKLPYVLYNLPSTKDGRPGVVVIIAREAATTDDVLQPRGTSAVSDAPMANELATGLDLGVGQATEERGDS